MSAISQTISNVLGGVSQQPDPVKIPGQVRQADNVYLDPTFGCSKRPGTQFIGKLAGDVPADAKWFPIFRDDQERYVCAIYHTVSAGTVVRVWAADSGVERTVTLRGSASEYLQANNVSALKALTINDYTILTNGEQTVTMNSDVTASQSQKALIVVNQVAYNTQYNVDFLRDGQTLDPVKVFKASRISVSPASFEVADAGACTLQDTQSFVESGTGTQTGLGFTLTATCAPTLVTTEVQGDTFPTGVATDSVWNDIGGLSGGRNAWWHVEQGNANNFVTGSFVYSTKNYTAGPGTITIRAEAQVAERDGYKYYRTTSLQVAAFQTNNQDQDWQEGTEIIASNTTSSDLEISSGHIFPAGSSFGYRITITSVQRGPDVPNYSYTSKYRVNASLNNGGSNWSVGDTVSVTMSGKSYTVTVEDVTFGYSYEAEASVSYTTVADLSTGALSVADIVANLVASISSLANFTALPVGNVIVVTRDDNRDFNLQVRGGAADKALYGLKESINDVSLLPPQCVDGFVLKVANSAQSDADDYYVKFKTEGGIPGQGSWEETVAPSIPINLNNGTMPHVLIRLANGNFDVRPLSEEFDGTNFWVGRAVGDEKTNPAPTFVDKSIRDCFFYMNRLGFISEDTVVMSQAGDYFNFFQGSAIAISDSDPIDMAASSTKPAKLKAAIGTPAGLLLFAENSQFLLSTQDVAFGPATVKMTEITNYSYNSDVEPVETGVSILFATSAETFTKVFELSTDSLQARALISENTRIVPEYIPPRLSLLSSVPNSSMVLMGAGDEDLYIFKFYNSGNERNLAGWSKWTMQTPIKMVEFAHDTGYFVGYNSQGESVLSRLELIDDPETSPIKAFGISFTPRLDHYIYDTQVTVTSVNSNTSRITLPAGFAVTGSTPFLVATFQGTETFYESSSLQVDSSTNASYFDVSSDISSSKFIVGLGYTMSVTLPSFFVKSGENNQADRRNTPMIENVYIDLYYSGRYTATIQKKGYLDRTVDLDVPKSDLYLANSAAIDEFSTQAIAVYSRGDLAKITISAPDPLPASFTSYSWEGHYSTRGIATR